MRTYAVTSEDGTRYYEADDADHALEQAQDAFPEDRVLNIQREDNREGSDYFEARWLA